MNPLLAILIVVAILLVGSSLTTWGLLYVTDLATAIAADEPAPAAPPVVQTIDVDDMT
jgi:hypothetical protein